MPYAASPRGELRKLGRRIVEIGFEGQVLGEIRLDLADAALGPPLDPRFGQIVLDLVQNAALVHAAMIEPRPEVYMSRTAHLFDPELPVRSLRRGLVSARQPAGGTGRQR